MRQILAIVTFLGFLLGTIPSNKANAQASFEGKYYSGSGDIEYLRLLENASRMIRPDAELENLSMLYNLGWNGFVEGPTWNLWWIQNSFGPTYTMLPFLDKAFRTFVANSQDLWFSQMGNGLRNDANGYIAPPGCLCDCAALEKVYYRQGDGRHKIHDWVFGMTAAGIILQSELLLVSRDMNAIKHYVPLLEKSVDFIDSRRDPVKNIFLAGTGANLLAPSYTGSGKIREDGTYEMAYLAEISINYMAALNRLIELEKILKREKWVKLYQSRLEKLKEGLKYFIHDDGYFIRSLDKDGTSHGIYGAKEHGYFEAAPNHDAMAFRIADDKQAKKIYAKIKSIPGLRPHHLILANYPGYDELYDNDGFFSVGTWVNAGHWSTAEARMLLGYYRVGAYDDAKESFKRIEKLAFSFKLDNPLKNYGADLWQPKEAINCVYDCWGVPGGFLRGLFEYEYKADGIIIYPHIPHAITQLQQKMPVYFGDKKMYISTSGKGSITAVYVNGKKMSNFNPDSFYLKMDVPGDVVNLAFGLGGEPAQTEFCVRSDVFTIPDDEAFWNVYNLKDVKGIEGGGEKIARKIKRIGTYYNLLIKGGLTNTFEADFAKLILENTQAIYERKKRKDENQITLLLPDSQNAADALYVNTVENLYNGLVNHIAKDHSQAPEQEKQAATIWHGMFK